VTSLIATGTKNMLVSDLIDHAEHKWKPCIINMLFNDRDVQNITIMPIIDEVNDDKHIWSFTLKRITLFVLLINGNTR
jgi:hypothetical protein